MTELPAEETPGVRVDRSSGVQIGSGNVQNNYFGPGWSGGASTPLPSPSGTRGAVEEGQGQGHAFMSYDREDSGDVDLLQHLLETAGVRVWRDTADLWPGEDWRARIRSAIADDALVFIACFSCRSVARVKSRQNEELVLAVEQLRQRRPDRPWLIPVRFDDCDLPDYDLGAGRTLSSIQQADLFGPGRDLAARRVVEAVQRLLKQLIVRAPEPRDCGRIEHGR